ncbi:MAG: TetR/AcrR family transcriptional regulator [Gemmatirosa sp.]|nr:TetR/AcrR family transcriptional regulator [Gemmatirosa sp.]
MLENRARILDAAARVYAEFGYRGATTRRIAVAAGVNEVTLFRTFGSKAALIDEAVRSCAELAGARRIGLPDEPVDPEQELTAWATALLAHLRETRSIMRKSMSEMEERPDVAPCVTSGISTSAEELRAYMRRLGELGYVDWESLTDEPPAARRRASTRGLGARVAAGASSHARAEEAYAAGSMLVAALMSDAMGRDMMPGLYPEPADRAPALYVRLFLRAVRCAPTPRRRARPTSKQTRS